MSQARTQEQREHEVQAQLYRAEQKHHKELGEQTEDLARHYRAEAQTDEAEASTSYLTDEQYRYSNYREYARKHRARARKLEEKADWHFEEADRLERNAQYHEGKAKGYIDPIPF